MRGDTRDGLPILRDAHGYVVTTGGTVPQGNLTPQLGQLDAAINAAVAAARDQEIHNVAFSGKVAKAKELKNGIVDTWILPMSAFA
jgi:hypothetical protein